VYLLPRRHALAAIAAVRGLAPALRPVLQVSELRVVAADELWMSPQHGTPTLAIHFTWKREPEAVAAVLGELEAALAPFAPRPHWGKLFRAGAEAIAPRYPRAADFAALAARLDPRGAFRNAWLERTLLDAL
jgi:xylitol oxidase